VVAPNLTDLLRDYWREQYVVTDQGFAGAVRSLGERVRAAFQNFAVVGPRGVLPVAAAAAVVVIWRRPLVAVLTLGPWVLAATLAVFEVAPLGTNRTDLYLYPLVMVLGAVAVDALVGLVGRRTRIVACVAVLGVALVLPFRMPPASYRQEDVRSLVAVLESNREPGDAILIYPYASFAWALYTDSEVELEPSDDFATTWAVRSLDPDTTVLATHRADPEAYVPLVEAATRGRERVWFLASHWAEDLGDLQQLLTAEGFSLAEQVERPGAVLQLWTRPAASEPAR
jgi:hypothetical protein